MAAKTTTDSRIVIFLFGNLYLSDSSRGKWQKTPSNLDQANRNIFISLSLNGPEDAAGSWTQRSSGSLNHHTASILRQAILSAKVAVRRSMPSEKTKPQNLSWDNTFLKSDEWLFYIPIKEKIFKGPYK